MKINKKQLKCPICGQRIIDALANDSKTELIPEEQIKEGYNPDFFQKCPKCKNQIAIKKVG